MTSDIDRSRLLMSALQASPRRLSLPIRPIVSSGLVMKTQTRGGESVYGGSNTQQGKTKYTLHTICLESPQEVYNMYPLPSQMPLA
jgi:hypothetical protein